MGGPRPMGGPPMGGDPMRMNGNGLAFGFDGFGGVCCPGAEQAHLVCNPRFTFGATSEQHTSIWNAERAERITHRSLLFTIPPL